MAIIAITASLAAGEVDDREFHTLVARVNSDLLSYDGGAGVHGGLDINRAHQVLTYELGEMGALITIEIMRAAKATRPTMSNREAMVFALGVCYSNDRETYSLTKLGAPSVKRAD
jgi:hypothetical protein